MLLRLFLVRMRGAVGLSHSLMREYPKSVVRQAHSASHASLGAAVGARNRGTSFLDLHGILTSVFNNLRSPTSLISAIGLAYNRFRVLPYEGVGQTDSADKAKQASRAITSHCQRQMVTYGH
jgi:hypothetical protein